MGRVTVSLDLELVEHWGCGLWGLMEIIIIGLRVNSIKVDS